MELYKKFFWAGYFLFRLSSWLLLFDYLNYKISLPLFLLIEADNVMAFIGGIFEGYENGILKSEAHRNGKS